MYFHRSYSQPERFKKDVMLLEMDCRKSLGETDLVIRSSVLTKAPLDNSFGKPQHASQRKYYRTDQSAANQSVLHSLL